MQGEQEQAKAASEGVEKFMTAVRRHMNFEELTHTLLREFVEKIVVHEAEDTGSGRKQQIDYISKVLRHQTQVPSLPPAVPLQINCPGLSKTRSMATIAAPVRMGSP